MPNAILIQQIYPDTPGVAMLELTRKRHSEYCKKHNLEFQSVVDGVVPEWNPLNGSWAKVELIHRALKAGYKKVVWLDADTIIANLEEDLRDGCPDSGIGACWHRIPQLNHWNVGALYLNNTPPVLEFIEAWKKAYPGDPQWMEQGIFNTFAMQSKVVTTISDRWNATIHWSEVPDAVVLGYHGAGNTAQRIELMRGALEKLKTYD